MSTVVISVASPKGIEAIACRDGIQGVSAMSTNDVTMESSAEDGGVAAKRRRWPVFLALGVVVALVAAGVVVGMVVSRSEQTFPSTWDPQVAPIAARVEALRGLRFKHPVKVNYLSVSAFEKQVTASPAELKKQAKQTQQASALLRAAGLIGPNVDLADAFNTTSAADTDAFYDPGSKQIFVRGAGPFTIQTRVTVAHELTHVLQDQNFDLPKLERRAEASTSGSLDAFTALVEGDASRIEDKYLAEQSPADRRDYDRLSSSSSNQADQRTKDLPAVVGTIMGAPYAFGPPVINILDTAGGNAAINAALTGPTPSTRIYFDPTAVNTPPEIPPVPALAAGEKKITLSSSNDAGFDAFTLYLMLGARLDRPSALLAADAYSAGSEALYSRAGTTCLRAAIVGVNPANTHYLGTVIEQWVHSMPDAAIDSSGNTVVFHTCDPGAHAQAPNDTSINQAMTLAVVRDQIIASAVGPQVPAKVAVCVTRVLVQQPDMRDAILANSDTLNNPTPQMLSESVAAGAACRNNLLAGLPGTSP